MQKTKVLCLILAIALASAGTVGIVMGLDGDTTAPVMPDNVVNMVLDKPSEGTPTDCSAIDNLYIAQGELQRKGGFVGTTRGTTTSAGIKQDVINNRVVSNGNVFKEMITVGIVKNAYQLFMYEGNYLYRKYDSIKSASNIKWADTASKYSENDFLEKFGHRSDSLTGYILNNDTIVSGELEKEENGLYQYRYVLDVNTAPARMLLEMKTNSNMNGYSTFSKAEIVVVMDKDWQVKTLTTDCKYKVPMFGGVDCVEDITETFSDLTSQALPEMSFFEQFFNADVQAPADKEVDALSILMEMFSPYIGNGNSLNASIVATNNGQTVLNGLVSAKIDIENLENIEVAAKIGDDLFVEYQQGSVYVAYQDFKASTTVDGIMGVVNAFMPQTNVDAQADESSDDILSKFTYEIVDNVCTVSLPLELGDENIELNIYANVTENGYEFTNAVVAFGSLEINVEPTGQFEMPEREGEYPEILGLLDLVHNGVIYGNVDAFGINADVMFDISTQSLYATSDNLSLIYQNNTVYVELGAIKAKLNSSDFDRVLTLLRLAGIIDGNDSIELPQISLEQIVSLLANINATKTDNGVEFCLSMGDMYAAVYLVTSNDGWNVDKLTVTLGENVVTLAVTEPTATEIPNVDDDQYADVMALLNTIVNPIVSLTSATSYGAEFNFDLSVGGSTYNVAGNFAYDANKNIKVNAIVSNDIAKLINANVVVANGVVYLDVNGLKAAFSIGETSSEVDLSQIVNAVGGIDDGLNDVIDAIYGIVETVKNLDVATVDFVNLVKQFSFVDGNLALTVNADFIGLGDIDVQLSVNKYNNLVASVGGLNIANLSLSADATIIANIGKIKVPNSSDYVLNLAGSVNDIDFVVAADLLNMDISASVDVFNQTILLRYVDDKVYVVVDEMAVVGTVSELGKLVDYVMSAIGVDGNAIDMGDLASVDLSLETLLKAIDINVDGALNVALNLEGIAKVAVNFDNEANLVDVTVVVAGCQLKVEKSDRQVEKLDINRVYIPIESLAKQIVDIYKNIFNNGISANISANVTVDNAEYRVNAVINYNNGLYVNANISYNTANMLNVELWWVDNTLYVSVGDLKLAIAMSQMTSTPNDDSVNLARFKGYNSCVDNILDVIQNVIDKCVSGNVDYMALIDSFTFADGELALTVNGEQFGISRFLVKLIVDNGLTANVENIAIDNMTANLNASIEPSNTVVAAPQGDYTTNLMIRIDEKNTVYANLDFINGVYNFRLDDMYVTYSDNIVKINKGDIYVSGNINQIIEYVKKIDDLVNEFSGATESTVAKIDFNMFKNVDLKAIVNSLKLNASGEKVTLSVQALGFDISAILAYGKIHTVTVPVSLIDKTLQIEPCKSQAFDKFDGEHEYIQIEQVFNDYFPAFERLVHTNSWVFHFDGDTLLSIGETNYKVAAGSYFEFYYKNTEGMDTFKLRAKLDVHKQKSDGSWQPYMNLDIMYKDGNIYVTDKGRLVDGKTEAERNTIKITVSVNTLVKCYGLYDDIVAVVPQIGELVEQMMAARSEAEKNAESISYSTILSDVSYVNGLFGLDLNGSALISKLGVIALSAQTYGEGLSLNTLDLAYDNISVQINNLRVYASDVVETESDTEYAAVNDINDYDTSEHMDFNSLYELLSAFVITATPAECNDGARSFFIEGTALVTLHVMNRDLADIPIGLTVKVDIDKFNNVYVTAKVQRTEPEGALLSVASLLGINVYEDKGGDSYLYYDGVNETFTVIRNSIQNHNYCSKCNSYECSNKFLHTIHRKDKKVIDTEFYGYPSYKVENLSTEEFTANIMDYIMALFNFGSTIKDQIVGAMNKPNNNDFGIEDILENYAYSEEMQMFSVQADLTPISEQLGVLNIDICHKDDFSLTSLSVNINMLDGMCKANVPLELKPSNCGEARSIVEQVTLW